MSNAEFSSSVTYSPPGGGLLTQSFNVSAAYRSVSAGSVAITAGATAVALVIPFGGVGTDTKGLVIRNNTDVDLGIRLNGGTTDQYHLAPGGLVMHWAPLAAKDAASALKACSVMPAAAATEDGTIEYLVFGT